MSLGLHETTHDAERPHSFSILHQKSRNDRVKGLLSRSQAVFHVLVQSKICPAVLQRDSCPRDHDAGAKSHIVALDVGDHVSFPVCRAEIDRSAAERIAWLRILRHFPDQGSPLCRVFIRQKRLHRRAHIPRIRHIPVAVRECQLHRLQLLVHRVHTASVREGISFQDI